MIPELPLGIPDAQIMIMVSHIMVDDIDISGCDLDISGCDLNDRVGNPVAEVCNRDVESRGLDDMVCDLERDYPDLSVLDTTPLSVRLGA